MSRLLLYIYHYIVVSTRIFQIFRKIGYLSFVAFIAATKGHAQTILLEILSLYFKFNMTQYELKLYMKIHLHINLRERERECVKNNIFSHFKSILKNVQYIIRSLDS